jgi:hypothetical protein
MKSAHIKTILNVSCALALTAAFAPASPADVWTVNPNGRVTNNRATTSGSSSSNVSAGANNTRGPATNQSVQGASGGRHMTARGSQGYSSSGTRHWNGGSYPAPGYGYGVPGYGYYPPSYPGPYPVYEPPYVAPVAPDPIGTPAWVSSFGGGATYYYPYPNYNYYPPQVVYPPVIVSPYYPYPYLFPYGTATTGTGSISTSTNIATGGLSFGTGVMQGSQTGVMQPWIGIGGAYGRSSRNTTTTIIGPSP